MIVRSCKWRRDACFLEILQSTAKRSRYLNAGFDALISDRVGLTSGVLTSSSTGFWNKYKSILVQRISKLLTLNRCSELYSANIFYRCSLTVYFIIFARFAFEVQFWTSMSLAVYIRKRIKWHCIVCLRLRLLRSEPDAREAGRKRRPSYQVIVKERYIGKFPGW